MVSRWSSRSRLRFVGGASAIMALAILAVGCGGGSKDTGDGPASIAQLTSSGTTTHEKRETGQVKPAGWSVVAERRRALRLGMVLPYCVDGEPKPFIERVERRRGHGGLVFTVFVRFGPENPEFEGCAGVGLILGKWVRVGGRAKSKPLFDGSTSPPSRRPLPP